MWSGILVDLAFFVGAVVPVCVLPPDKWWISWMVLIVRTCLCVLLYSGRRLKFLAQCVLWGLFVAAEVADRSPFYGNMFSASMMTGPLAFRMSDTIRQMAYIGAAVVLITDSIALSTPRPSTGAYGHQDAIANPKTLGRTQRAGQPSTPGQVESAQQGPISIRANYVGMAFLGVYTLVMASTLSIAFGSPLASLVLLGPAIYVWRLGVASVERTRRILYLAAIQFNFIILACILVLIAETSRAFVRAIAAKSPLAVYLSSSISGMSGVSALSSAPLHRVTALERAISANVVTAFSLSSYAISPIYGARPPPSGARR